MNNYAKISQYVRIIPDYALALTYAKRKQNFWPLYIDHTDDLLQEIAIAAIEERIGTASFGRALSRRMYYLSKGLLPDQVARKSQAGRKVVKKLPPLSVCHECGRERHEYLRANIIAGKRICGACMMRIKREDRRRNCMP